MATLTEDEMERIKAELYVHVLDTGAAPYFNFPAAFDVVRDHVTSSTVASTTSTTTVSAAGPTTITLASATGYVAGQRIVIDCDEAREVVTIRSLAGAEASVVCKKTHSGTYPIEVESGLTIVRGIMADIESVDQSQRGGVDSVGVKRVDEIEFFGLNEGGSAIASGERYRAMLRTRLAATCGVTAMFNKLRAEASGVISAAEVY